MFQRCADDAGRYYGPVGAELALGVGLIYSGIRYPLYSRPREMFLTVAGIVLVLTHECDIDQANKRPFNRDVLVLPLAPFENFLDELNTYRDDSGVRAYLGDLVEGRIQQLVYLPEIAGALPYGAVLYMNRVAHTDVDAFWRSDVKCLGALTAYGLQQFDYRLHNHLLREKVDPLPLSQIR